MSVNFRCEVFNGISFYASAAYAAAEALRFRLVCPGVCPGFCPVTSVFLSLRNPFSRKDFNEICGTKSLPQTDEMVTFWVKLEQGQGSRIRQKIRTDVSRCCRDVKQVLTPSE